MSNPTDKASAAALPDPACYETGWEARFIDGAWRIGMKGNLDTKHDAVITVNQHTSDGEEAKRIAKWVSDQYNRALSPAQGDGMREDDDHCHGPDDTWCNVCGLGIPKNPDGMRDALVVVKGYLEDHIFWRCIPNISKPTETLGMMIDAALASHPDRQPGMTDEQANEILADECKKRTDGSLWNAAIAAIKRVSQGER